MNKNCHFFLKLNNKSTKASSNLSLVWPQTDFEAEATTSKKADKLASSEDRQKSCKTEATTKEVFEICAKKMALIENAKAKVSKKIKNSGSKMIKIESLDKPEPKGKTKVYFHLLRNS